jgi:glucose-1-phosphate cytidylyltransferase
MKVVILAGGYGTRIREETHSKPKPMVEIGGTPILLHIMCIYSHYGFHDFILCLGYKGDYIKKFFADYALAKSDVTFDFRKNGKDVIHRHSMEPWKVTLVDTSTETMTGGRLKRIQPYIENEPFMLTYGDGVSDVNIDKLVQYHDRHGNLATITTVKPPGRFGTLSLSESNAVTQFREKAKEDVGWINAGFFVMQPEVFDYIEGDYTVLEQEPLENLAAEGQLMAYKHHGFWHPMDTLKDKIHLQKLWESGEAPWKK